MDLSKSLEFFHPSKDESPIHIIGCGSVGSTIAENLVRCGVTKMTLWDFDNVEAHNVANQMYRQKDIGKPKVVALRDLLAEINPDVGQRLSLKQRGWKGQTLSGYLFLAVDSVELRREIVEKHMENPYIKAVFDFRTMLEGAQHYAADWSDRKMKDDLLKSMQFSHEEAAAETPVSACGVTLGVATTVRIISAIGVNNYINFVKGKGIKKLVLLDAFGFTLDAF